MVGVILGCLLRDTVGEILGWWLRRKGPSGWLLRRKGPSGFSYCSTAEEVTEGIDGTGLTAIVTGASSGIGMETSRVLALRGVHVIMGVRNLSTATDVKEAILKEIPNAKVDIVELDLSSMTSVRKFVADFNSLSLPLNILINNAGVSMAPFTLSKDGIELVFATNHIGHFLLTDLLLENMKTTAQKSGIEGRILNVSSEAYLLTYNEGIRFDKINDKEGYNRFFAYGQSKLANILHAQELSIRLKEQELNVTANSLHPGTIRTNILRHSRFLDGLFALGNYILKNVQQENFSGLRRKTGFYGKSIFLWDHTFFSFPMFLVKGAGTTCYAALHPQVRGVSGKYFANCGVWELKSHATNKEMAKKLWEFSVGLIS